MKLSKMTLPVLALLVTSSVNLSRAGEKKDIINTAIEAGSFKTLAAALEAADLVNALKGKGPFTVFAPTDHAFAQLPKGTVESLLKPENRSKLTAILTYHVVSDRVPAKDVVKLNAAETLNGQRVDIKVVEGKVKIDNATVLKTDIECGNGVIHVIDRVLLPSQDDIPTTATKAGKFNTLLAAAKAAGLVEALSSEGPLTVFAPTDAAFAKLPKGTVESLLKPENKSKLAAILKYHVVSGRVFSDDALDAGAAKTLQGAKVHISASDGVAKVNEAKLVALDIDASNGVIHIIDGVLLPPEKKKVSAAEGRKMIELAVHRGVRLFNAGHHEACARIYMSTIRKMVGYDMPPLVTDNLTTTLAKAKKLHSPTAQAWALRQGLDRAYHAMRDLDVN